MLKLEDQQNVNAADATYLDGSTRDKAGAVPGTIFSNGLMTDIIQFFQKLKREASITENELPDNEDNGHQLFDALLYKLKVNIRIVSTAIAVTFASDDNTIIFTLASGVSITTPSAAANNRRELRLVNQAPGAIPISSFINISGSTVTEIPSASATILQSNGTNWYQVS